jgi:hypothetical protein
MEPKRGRPLKYADPAVREQAAKASKEQAAKKYYEKKSATCCEKQRQYYEQHRAEILQKERENKPAAVRRPGRPRKVVEAVAVQ